jgi:hypothetical protein
MRVATIVLAFVLLSTPARAAVQFYGALSNPYPGGTSLSWSTDFGLPPSSSLAAVITGMNGFADSCGNYSPIAGGDVGAELRLAVAPAGLASVATPVVTFHAHDWASSSGSTYGRFGNANVRASLYLGPTVPEGGTVYYAIRWHSARTGSLTYATWGAYLGGWYYPVLVANQGSAADGVSYGTVVAPYDPLDVIFESRAGLGPYSSSVVDEDVTIEIFVDSAPLAGVETGSAPVALEFAPPRPNPSQGPRTFAFALPSRSDVSLRIVDVAGRLVRDLRPGGLEAGPHELAWDGRGRDGARLGAGVYWAQLSCTSATGTSSRRQKIVVLD